MGDKALIIAVWLALALSFLALNLQIKRAATAKTVSYILMWLSFAVALILGINLTWSYYHG